MLGLIKPPNWAVFLYYPIIDKNNQFIYNWHMIKNFDESIQWVGAVAIVAGHTMNTLIEYGYNVRPWNILAFSLGVLGFLTWAIRARNVPQTLVNVVSVGICALGLYRAL